LFRPYTLKKCLDLRLLCVINLYGDALAACRCDKFGGFINLGLSLTHLPHP